MRHVLLIATTIALAAVAFACGGTQQEHGTISDLSSVDGSGDVYLCEHEVPAEVCVQCHPELAAQFQEVGDWCGPHDVPESQCHRCHPDLEFTPLPDLVETADVLDLTDEQVLEGLEAHLASGKVTIVDFHAPWCAPCHNLEVHLRELVNTHDNLAVRRVLVMEWEGPIVEQYMADVPSLPYVRVYGPDGELVGDLSGFEHDELDALLEGVIPGS